MALVSKSTEKIILIGLGIGAVALIIAGKKTADFVSENINTVNPVSDENFINQGVSSVVQSATDGESKDLGGFLFCLLNPRATVCNPKRAALNQSIDTKTLNDEQIDLIFEQEKEFIDNQDFITPGAQGIVAGPEPTKENPTNPDIRF